MVDNMNEEKDLTIARLQARITYLESNNENFIRKLEEKDKIIKSINEEKESLEIRIRNVKTILRNLREIKEPEKYKKHLISIPGMIRELLGEINVK